MIPRKFRPRTVLGLQNIASLHLHGKHLRAVTTTGRVLYIELEPHIRVVSQLRNQPKEEPKKRRRKKGKRA